MAATTYDVAVIGAGPGGYVAAIRAAQLGLKTVIIEREHLGGICLNWGCIPTKALLRTSEIFHLMHRAKEFGLKAENIGYDLDAVVKRSRGVAKQLSSGVGFLMKKNKITVVMGEATLAGKGKISVKTEKGTEEIEAKSIIVATGARARDLPGLEADGKRVWNYKHALVPPHMPKKLLVIGSGAIGIEFASFYNTLGRGDDGGRGARPHPAGRGRRDLGLRQEAVPEAEDDDPRGGHRSRSSTARPTR